MTVFLWISNLQFFAVCKFCRITNRAKERQGGSPGIEGCQKGQTLIQHRTVHWHRTCQAQQRKANAVAIATERRTSGSTSRESRVDLPEGLPDYFVLPAIRGFCWQPCPGKIACPLDGEKEKDQIAPVLLPFRL